MQVIQRATMIRKRSTAAKQDLACTSAATEPTPVTSLLGADPARRQGTAAALTPTGTSGYPHRAPAGMAFNRPARLLVRDEEARACVPGIDQTSYRLAIDAGHNEGTSLREDAG
jgi:hypothetical protein